MVLHCPCPLCFFFFRSCAFSLLLGNKSLLKHANTLTWPGKALLKTQNNAIKINYQHDTCHVIHFFPIFSLFFFVALFGFDFIVYGNWHCNCLLDNYLFLFTG